jgi:hypothetical protein
VRQLVALLGLLWVAANLWAAYLFVTSGFTAKVAAKGFVQQALLWSGGLLIGLFALLLAWQSVALAVSRDRPGEAAQGS